MVCELLQRGGVEAEGRERRRRHGVVVAGLLQRRQLVGGEARHGGEEEADAVHVLQGGFLAAHRPAAQRRPAEGGAPSLATATLRRSEPLFPRFGYERLGRRRLDAFKSHRTFFWRLKLLNYLTHL